MWRTILAALAFAAAAAIAACGGGAVSAPTRVVPPTPVPVPSSSPQTLLQQIPVSVPAAGAGATPVPVALPTLGGFAPAMGLPLPPAAATAQWTVVLSNVAFSSLPPLSRDRFGQTVRRAAALPGGAAVLIYVEIYSSATMTLPTAPSFTIAIPSDDVFAGADYYLALNDPTRPSLGWQYGFEGPATVTDGTLAFAPNPAPFTVAADLSYYFALYVIPHGSAQPTAAPSVAPMSVPTQAPPTIPPTPGPSPSPTAGGNVVVIVIPTPSPVLCTPAPVAVAVGQTAVVDCTAQGYGGPFTWTVADPTIASVQQYNSETFTYFTVTGLAAGTTTLSLRSQPGGTGSLSITVSP
jgi:hypothetical protein